MLIQWLLGKTGKFSDDQMNASFLSLDTDLFFNPGNNPPRPDPELEAARRGITGLIQLGAAWQSIDTFRALQLCLHSQRAASLAHLAYLRQKELTDAGATSLHPDEEVREAMKPFGNPESFHGTEAVERFYKNTRAAAAKRDQAWIAYQEERFEKGMHPDTHPDFWSAWKEPAMPALPGISFGHFANRYPAAFLIALVAAVVLLFTGLILGLRKLGRRA